LNVGDEEVVAISDGEGVTDCEGDAATVGVGELAVGAGEGVVDGEGL